MFPATFESERLRYRRLSPAVIDAFELYEHTGSEAFERVARHLTTDRHRTPKDALDFLEESESKWDDAERADWAMLPREGEDGAGEFAGVASLIPLWDRRTARLGVWLREPFWGREYSGERADALIRIAFERLDLEVVTAGCLDGNENSRRAIEKYVERHGGRYDGVLKSWVPLDGEDEVRDLHRYTISREEYDESGVEVDLAYPDGDARRAREDDDDARAAEDHDAHE